MLSLLLVGNGGREHAMAAAICRSEQPLKFYAFMGANNPGIAQLAREHGGEAVVGNITDVNAVVKWATSKGVDYAVVGPEAVLEAGVVNELERNGVKCASPCKEVARLETDKAFARGLMRKHKVPGLPEFGVFSDYRKAAEFIDELNGSVAIKPAGLTSGKGVKVTGVQLKDGEEAKTYAREVLEKSIGAVGGKGGVVVEEKLEGEEFTLQAFVDWKNIVGMPAVQDHKLAFEGDKGPNTGGMGSYSDANHLLPFVSRENYDSGLEIMRKTVEALKKETGVEYKGALYGQFMLTSRGPFVIEFNARFGDPEAMNVLTLLESDYTEIIARISEGSMRSRDAVFARKATVCKYLVPAGYPDSPKKNRPVSIDAEGIAKAGARLYYAAVNEEDGRIFTSSSRTAGIVGVAESISEAEKAAERACSFVKGELFHRRDIGTSELVQKRVTHMQALLGK